MIAICWCIVLGGVLMQLGSTAKVPTIMGIDASLTSSGIAITTFIKKIVILHTVKTTADIPIQQRILFIFKEIEKIIEDNNVHLILLENNYTGGSKEVNWVIGIIYLIAAAKGIAIKTICSRFNKKGCDRKW